MADMWQELIDQDPTSTVLHDLRLVQIVERIYKCQAVSQVINTPNGLCGIPAFKVISLLSGRKVTSMPFNFYPALLGVQDEQVAFLRLVELARQLGSGFYVEYKTFNTLSMDSLDGEPIFRTSPSIVSCLPLKEDYTAQQAGYSKSRRQDVQRTHRRALETGIEFTRASSLTAVREFYNNVLSRLYRNKHRMIPHPWTLFEQIYQVLVPIGLADFYLARLGQAVLAGIVVLKKNCHWEYCWAASSIQYQALGLNAILVDWAIQEAIVAGAKTFGFGSSSPLDKLLLHFKDSWGCEHRPIYYYYWHHQPRPIDLENSFPTLRRFIPYIPLWLIQVVVPYVVPQLA